MAPLRHARRVARLSQRDLARRAGVSQSLVARIESRRVDPPVGQMQLLLGLCGMRWELQLVGGGVTPALGSARNTLVQRRARRRDDASAGRRMRENAAARDMAISLADEWVTGREIRRRCKEARLAERAAQAGIYAALVSADDDEARGWVSVDAKASQAVCSAAIRLFEVSLVDRLPAILGDPESTELRELLTALADEWACPRVALTGSLARAVWSPSYRLPARPVVELAPLRGRREAHEFLAGVRAVPCGEPRMFRLGRLRLRLLPTAPQSTSLVLVRFGKVRPAVPVARPESRPGAACDRHAVRAALAAAGRDRRGRRHPPYHETWDGAVRPWWVASTVGRASTVG